MSILQDISILCSWINRNFSQNRHNLKILRFLVPAQHIWLCCQKIAGLSCYSTLCRWVYAKCRPGL